MSQIEAFIEVWNREGDSWSQREARSGARIALRSIDCDLVVDELYRGVFEP